MTALRNWAGNYEYSTQNLHAPTSLEETQALVKRLDRLRVLGTRHSFNSIADSGEHLITLANYPPLARIDHERQQVTISGSVTYGTLSPILHEAGFALHNLASLPHISVAGAVATATHGSGVHNRNLAAAVAALEIVTANGDLIRLSREDDGDIFDGAVVNLGALGVVVSLTLDLLPAFEMEQTVYLKLPLAQLDAHFDAIMASAYSVSLFTDWQSEFINQVWLKARVEAAESAPPPPEFFGATQATRNMHPIAEISAENCTYQLGSRGGWHERLPHFRIDAMPSAGDELQTEYFVARAHALDAIHAVASLGSALAPHLLISEIRTIAADDLWLSPCYKQDSVALHFTWKRDWQSVRQLLPQIEARLAPFQPRPHWGKLFTLPPGDVQSRYEKLPQFRSLLEQYDPSGKFRNAFVESMIF